MKLSETITGLKEDLGALAALADEATARAGERIAAALGPAATLRLLEVLGHAAAEVSDQLAGARAELRVAGDEAALVVVEERGAGGAEPDAGEAPGDYTARLTLRLPEQLKARVEEAAAQDGASTNSWVVRALARATAASAGSGAGAGLGFGVGGDGGGGGDGRRDDTRLHGVRVRGGPGRRLRGFGTT